MATLPINKAKSILHEIEGMQNRIMLRAYEIFEATGHGPGSDLENWLQAEQELFRRPSIELRETDNEFLVSIALPGIGAKDVSIQVTPEDLLVKGETHHEHKEEKERVHICEFGSGSIFRTIHFPKKVDPDKVKGEFKDGIISLKLPIAREEQPEKTRKSRQRAAGAQLKTQAE
jgi:HSP20 family molecular chaperone IbpA